MSPVQSQMVAERYRLAEPLGEGGMGRVWRATDEVLQRTVAVKEIIAPGGLTAAERVEMQERFLREARAIARLSHPNVVRIFDVVRTDAGHPWIVMEFVPSQSLEQAINDDGVLSPARTVHIGLGVLHALRAAHAAGLVHRDVKPANVLLGDDGRVVLTDFGLATGADDPTVTRTGVVLGSPAYIAPERARDGSAGPAADLWSLGATLYAAVEGHAPFARPTTIETLAALVSEEVQPARRAGPLRALLDGLLRKDPAERIDAAEAERLLLRAAGIRRRGGAPSLSLLRRQRPAAGPPVPVQASAPAPEAEPAAEPASVAETAPVVAAVAPVVPAQPGSDRSIVDVPVPAPASPAVPPGQRRPPPAWLVAIAVAALVAVIALIASSLSDDSPRQGGSAPGGGPTPAGQEPTGSVPTTTGGAPPATTAAAPPPTTAPAAGVLPAGWHLHQDPTGFKVAVPDGWRIQQAGTMVYFRETGGGGRVLGIDQSRQPKPDPVADWRAQESYRVGRGDWADYRQVKLGPVNYFVKAADWEYTFRDGNARRHVMNRGFITSPTQAYAIYWATPDAVWAANLDEFELITKSFVPRS